MSEALTWSEAAHRAAKSLGLKLDSKIGVGRDNLSTHGDVMVCGEVEMPSGGLLVPVYILEAHAHLEHVWAGAMAHLSRSFNPEEKTLLRKTVELTVALTMINAVPAWVRAWLVKAGKW